MTHRLRRVLFILKRRTCYAGYGAGFSSGLYNSAKFAADMLSREPGYIVKLIEVTDNNDIDREVFRFDPDVVIIEALWVVPSKMVVLHALHPKVQWIVRVHSEAAFLAQEGIGVRWIYDYEQLPNVHVAMNSEEGRDEVGVILGLDPLLLPTFYPAPRYPIYTKRFTGPVVEIAAMGAIRVLKNHLIQALAAIQFAEENNLLLRFHVNMTRVEVDGNAPYKSVVDLFAVTGHQLILHDWMSHDDFITFLGTIDLGLQVSFSETFNIVAADMAACGVPIVASPAIRWLDDHSKAHVNSIESIVEHMEHNISDKGLIKKNFKRLQNDAKDARKHWLTVLENLV